MMMGYPTSHKYMAVAGSANEMTDMKPWEMENTESKLRSTGSRTGIQIVILVILTVSLAGDLSFSLLLLQRNACEMPAALYSPAQDVLTYEARVFGSGFGLQTTAYQGPPSEASDDLWSNLYSVGITRITSDEARPMLNKTLPIPDDKGHYIIQLSVFHQLHCLNMIRYGLYNKTDWSDTDDLLGITHLDHCIDTIRQSLMCSADITPLTWARDTADRRPKPVVEVVHTCRDFGALQRWAGSRQLKQDFNYAAAVVTDDPLGWGDYEIETRIVTDRHN